MESINKKVNLLTNNIDIFIFYFYNDNSRLLNLKSLFSKATEDILLNII